MCGVVCEVGYREVHTRKNTILLVAFKISLC